MGEFKYYLEEDDQFINYLTSEEIDLSEKQARKYSGHLKTIYNKILNNKKLKLDLGIIFEDLKWCVAYYNKNKKPDEALKGLKLVSNFIRRIYSLARIDKNISTIGNRSRSFLYDLEIEYGSFKDYATALDHYIAFIDNYQKSKSYEKPAGYYKKRYKISDYNNACKKLNSIFHDKISVNGIDSLLEIFENSSPTSFISHILKNSFFFSQTSARNQFKDISNLINDDKRDHKKDPLFARKSGRKEKTKVSKFSFKSEIDDTDKEIIITIDSDGNKAVRDLIKKETGYTLSSGENCLFTNYIISHIWGDAFDPRNFTNFWNLALVPAWANPLLDKQNYKDILTNQLLNTFKAICWKQYGVNRLQWKKIYKKYPPLEPKYVMKDEYTINVIYKHPDSKPYGSIVVVNILIDDNDITEWENLFPSDNTTDI